VYGGVGGRWYMGGDEVGGVWVACRYVGVWVAWRYVGVWRGGMLW
jgi:hypothetical protein